MTPPYLSPREKQILVWVFRHQPTTFREVAVGVGLRSSGTVWGLVRRLIRLGLLGQYRQQGVISRGLHTTSKVGVGKFNDRLYYYDELFPGPYV